MIDLSLSKTDLFNGTGNKNFIKLSSLCNSISQLLTNSLTYSSTKSNLDQIQIKFRSNIQDQFKGFKRFKEMNNYKEKILNLLDNSKLSLIEHELKIISFISALTSYKADSLLRPLPNDFFNDSKNKKVEDFDRLVCF